MWGRSRTSPRVYAIALSCLAAAVLVVRTAIVQACPECGSTRRVSQVHFGVEESSAVPLSPVFERIVETEAARGLLGPGHEHRWEWRDGRAGGRFLLSGTCCLDWSKSRPNPFVRDWEENVAFRRLVEAERAAGRLPPAEIALIARTPLRPGWREAEDPAVAARIARAQSLFAASGASDCGGAWARWTVPPLPTRTCPGPPKR